VDELDAGQVESFRGYCSEYKLRLLALLPEFFTTTPLLATPSFHDMDASEAIRNLADYTDEIVSRMSDLAVILYDKY